MINFLKYRKIYFIFSGILLIFLLICLVVFGLKMGIDFTGGSILEVEFEDQRPQNQEIKEKLTPFNLGEIVLQPTGEKGIIIRTKEISEDLHQEILKKLGETYKFKEQRFESIGPIIGRELKEKTKLVIIFSLLAILFYIALAFRKISRPFFPWQWGMVSTLALLHDVLVPLGVISILGKFYNVQFTIPTTVALLTIIGYSINNTVVVFDRMRENFFKYGKNFEELINRSLNETLSRQINTSFTTLLPLIFIFFFGGETLKYFSLVLVLGILAGTYSSLFLVSPILFEWISHKKK
jgi:preprotein translocase subunit SecF